MHKPPITNCSFLGVGKLLLGNTFENFDLVALFFVNRLQSGDHLMLGRNNPSEPLRLCRRPFCLSHAAMAVSLSMAK